MNGRGRRSAAVAAIIIKNNNNSTVSRDRCRRRPPTGGVARARSRLAGEVFFFIKRPAARSLWPVPSSMSISEEPRARHKSAIRWPRAQLCVRACTVPNAVVTVLGLSTIRFPYAWSTPLSGTKKPPRKRKKKTAPPSDSPTDDVSNITDTLVATDLSRSCFRRSPPSAGFRLFHFGTPRTEHTSPVRHVPEPVDQETLDPETGHRQTVVDQLEQYEKIRRHVERQQEQETRRRQDIVRICADGKTEAVNENDRKKKRNARATRKEA